MKQTVILILPGWQDSEPEQWQGIWLKKFPNAVKVEQYDWIHTDKQAWVKTLNEYIEKHKGDDIIFVGHSLACVTFAYWSKEYAANSPVKVKGALLVGPADMEAPDLPQEITGFSPVPLERLNCPTIVVASEDDPYVSMDRAKYFAQCWQARLVNIGRHGHINLKAGFGDWPEGEKLLGELME